MKIIRILLLLATLHLSAEEPIKKVALLFLTVGELNHPNVWKKALQGNEDKFTIYVHSKNPLRDEFFQKYRIPKIVPTTWANNIKAEQALMEEAMKNEDNYKFVLLSEACSPLKPLDEIYDELVSNDKSYISYGPAWWFHEERILHEFPIEHRMANSQWIVLSRRHAGLMAADNLIIDVAAEHDYDNEGYPATFLSLRNELSNVIDRALTYVNFQHQNVKGGSPYHFFSYDDLSKRLLVEAQEKKCLFARKFTRAFPESVLMEFIEKKKAPAEKASN